MNKILATIIASGFAVSSSAAQTDNGASSAELDFDTLAACAIVYQEISAIYEEQGDAAEAESLASTARAYSASAYHKLHFRMNNPRESHDYAESQMDRIAADLSDQAESNDEGEIGVIEDWLPYCDHLGPQIDRILAEREQSIY